MMVWTSIMNSLSPWADNSRGHAKGRDGRRADVSTK